MTGFIPRFHTIQARIDRAARASGRDPEEIRILPVSKFHPVAALREALAAGVSEFGENRPQDLAAKAQILGQRGIRRATNDPATGAHTLDLGERTNRDSQTDLVDEPAFTAPRWVLIGNLQRNKTKLILAHAAEMQTLDSLKLAQTLSRHLADAGRELEVMIQVNISGESAKHGVKPEAAPELAAAVTNLAGLRLTGFMGIAAPLAAVGQNAVSRQFARLRAIRDEVVAGGIPQANGLSMGMSGDFEIAIAQGATVVRIGSALFGPRPPKPTTPVEAGNRMAGEGA